MAGLGHERAAGGDRGHLQASDADREHVIGTLKAAYVYGLVTKDEFDARVSQTFASRTYAELALVAADLPAGLAAAQQRPRPAPARGNAPADANVRTDSRVILATAASAGIALATSFHAGPFTSPAVVLLLLGGTGSAVMSLFLVGKRMRGSRRGKRSAGQLPPHRAIHSL